MYQPDVTFTLSAADWAMAWRASACISRPLFTRFATEASRVFSRRHPYDNRRLTLQALIWQQSRHWDNRAGCWRPGATEPPQLVLLAKLNAHRVEFVADVRPEGMIVYVELSLTTDVFGNALPATPRGRHERRRTSPATAVNAKLCSRRGRGLELD